MPLPWLIGAAVVAAAAVVVKAVSDDDSPSSSDSGDAERRRQEREARLQRERDGLAAKMDGLKKDRLVEARDSLARSVESLTQLQRKTDVLSTSDFERALQVKHHAKSPYSKGIVEILGVPELNRKDFTQKEMGEFLVNLQIVEVLYGHLPFDRKEQQDLAEIWEVRDRLDRRQHLKQQLEQQG